MFRPSPVKRIGFVGLGKLGLPRRRGDIPRAATWFSATTLRGWTAPRVQRVRGARRRVQELPPGGRAGTRGAEENRPIDDFLKGPGSGVQFSARIWVTSSSSRS